MHQPRIPPCRAVVSADGSGPTTPPEVRWIAPAFAEDRQLLHAWCETVGGVVADTAPERPDPGGIDSLVVLTWNVHVGGGDLLRLVDSLRAGALTGGRPPRHFVLLLQEVHRTAPRVLPGKPGIRVPRGQRHAPADGERTDVVRAARELGLALYYVPSMRNGYTGDPATEEDRGNAVLSTLPLSGLTVVELPVLFHRSATGEVGRVARVGHRFGSDHHPLLGRIPVPRGTAACAAPGDGAP